MTLKHYSSDEAIKRREAGRTDRLDPQEFINLCQAGEADLMTIDLHGADLGGITVKEGATLYGSNLSKVNLSQASLVHCTLNEVDLSGADLRQANLTHSYLGRANLRQASLSGAILCEAELGSADLREAILAGANLEKAKLDEANLSGANLSGARLAGANLKWANLSGANLDGVDLSETDLGGAILPDGMRSGTLIEAEAVSVDEAQKLLKAQIPEGSLLIAQKILSKGERVIRSQRTLEVEGASLEEARRAAEVQIPAEFQQLSEKILAGAKPETARGAAETTAAAFEKAQGVIPAGASILEKKEIEAPRSSMMFVEGQDEPAARITAEARAKATLNVTARVNQVKLVKAGAKGLFGIGAKPNLYEVAASAPAVVEIVYQPKVRLACEIGMADQPPARVIARIATVEQELSLMREALTVGGFTGSGWMLQNAFGIAENLLMNSTVSKINVVIPFYQQDMMIHAGLDALISGGQIDLAMATLDKFFDFISALKLVLSLSDESPSQDLTEYCAGTLSATLTVRYAKIHELTDSLEAAKKTVVCAEEGLKLMPGETPTVRNASRSHRSLGAYYARCQNWPAAIEELQRSVEIDPDYDNAWWLLSQCYRNSGDNKMSLACCRRAAELGHPDAVDIMNAVIAASSGRR